MGLQALPLLQLQGNTEDAFEPQPAPPKPRIASSITAAHRPELFRRSWHSFQARCLDCHEYISSWYAVDDGSSPEALAQMQQAAPPCAVTWLEKGPQQAGHVGSLNRILEEVHAQGFDYLLHLEDDWYFTAEDEFVSKALRIMDHDPSIAQVLFNKDYADTDAPWEHERISPGQQHITSDGLQYVLHVYAGPTGSPDLAAYVAEHAGGKLNHFHWPGFSLRPGLWRMSAIKQAGQFEPGVQFEHAFALKLHAAGYAVAFLPRVVAVHLAPTAVWLQERQADLDAVYARHGLLLQHTPGQQRSAYAANLAWR
ncbi:hypothetical protein OEZ85_008844 [Tetradesmus obliquus]|uniref:Glycosyltransferase 2-like domain-containing protein n=1 Tax=Tetradesmus obliquus TaxID=3088 RepID=A0ABY8TKE2_TETOB|nr:hypothetical protein OEZ85_008844 [Tetradesmus obliquus]